MQGSQPDPSSTDPFGTADLRRRVLDAWRASPARFREDANAEEDYALGGYRDRVIVELAQNAADAAARAAIPGHLRLTLRSGTLEAANTGAPLTAAGVASLSTLRASSKRAPEAQPQPPAPLEAGAQGGSEPGAQGNGGVDGPLTPLGGGGWPIDPPEARAYEETVGRFGVGFAAAVAVSDEPRIDSLTGAVSWSRTAAGDLVRQTPELASELALRSGHLPVLRLPFAADGVPPDGFATAVTLPLRDEAAVQLVHRLLTETGPALLLALPALATVEIDVDGTTRTLTAAHDGNGVTITVDGTATRWRTAAAAGQAALQLLADRPAEERARPSWSIRWAIPVTPSGEHTAPSAQGLPGGSADVSRRSTTTPGSCCSRLSLRPR